MTNQPRRRATSSAKLSHATDSGLTSGNSLKSQLTGVLLIALLAVGLLAGVAFLADPNLRAWGLGLLGLVIVAVAFRFWKRQRDRVSMDEAFTDLSDH